MQPGTHDASQVIQPKLNAGERLVWSGQPRRGLLLSPGDGFAIPFSLLWCGFAVFWEFSVNKIGNAPLAFRLFGVPFVLAGLYIVFGRFFVDAAARGRTFYGVTDERIVIVSGLRTRETKSLALRTLTEVSLTERADGSGTVAFGPQNPIFFRLPAGWPRSGQFAPPQFLMIENAKKVYDLIQQQQKAAV